MRIPTVAVRHPDDPSIRIIVNESDADAYEAWVEPEAEQAPAAGGGDPVSEDAGEDAAEPELEHQGGGWYVVRVGDAYLRGEDGEAARFHGRQAALDALAEAA